MWGGGAGQGGCRRYAAIARCHNKQRQQRQQSTVMQTNVSVSVSVSVSLAVFVCMCVCVCVCSCQPIAAGCDGSLASGCARFGPNLSLTSRHAIITIIIAIICICQTYLQPSICQILMPAENITLKQTINHVRVCE